MPGKKAIVFVSHDASLSGAPILLLNLLTLLKDQGSYDCFVIIKRGGALEKEFSKLFPYTVLKPTNYIKGGPISTFLDVGRNRLLLLINFYRCLKADVIFSNTITNGRLLKWLKKTRTPIISYIHELETAAGFFDQWNDSSLTIANSHLLLYPSQAVANFLYRKYNVKRSATNFLPYYFPEKNVPLPAQKSISRSRFASAYKLDENHLWIVTMGTISLRKGIDIFLDVAKTAVASHSRIAFIWIGAPEDKMMSDFIKYGLDVSQKSRIIFTGPVPFSPDNLLPFDLFFLPSREDPYPLVVLEAAYLAVPSICFAGTGGIPEFIEEDAGWLVKDFSPEATLNCIAEIDSNRSEILVKGLRAREKVCRQHSDKKSILDKFNDAVCRVLTS